MLEGRAVEKGVIPYSCAGLERSFVLRFKWYPVHRPNGEKQHPPIQTNFAVDLLANVLLSIQLLEPMHKQHGRIVYTSSCTNDPHRPENEYYKPGKLYDPQACPEETCTPRWLAQYLWPNGLFRTAEKSAQDLLPAALEPKHAWARPTEAYFNGSEQAEAAVEAKGEKKQQELWGLSLHYVGLDDESQTVDAS
ncbi:hypothetical protein H112_01777 [Trichophyton rubrum D6]|nr:uncharacterized protein TERG_06548 [Trichophyton rubrum CBS 118892]EZF25960.1 oxidoreductase [Trichophyton rubrum MR850]EZF45036.1 hypothetical protein H102_01766 [Trichophyton rubrum CBS 100081]EZF55728.1 hypothetical protein H103_01777 [Trichophyton rubrum CBS 288.86]EZF66273.1 hypothetical protein H104_01755 [Trichophyton rubrum CBS 289.86]EZF76954.1 oxidoreductase [Trichophyton soudanense CBS 452.61]EZF87590.1 oxidoreductase [Trichophyton rubrum MR1448]EZF98409.1 hypothetical protein 